MTITETFFSVEVVEDTEDNTFTLTHDGRGSVSKGV
jgi:hypothetical protein